MQTKIFTIGKVTIIPKLNLKLKHN